MHNYLENYHKMVKNTDLASILVDNKGLVDCISPALAELLELSPDEKKNISGLLDHEKFAAAGMADSFRQCVKTNRQMLKVHSIQKRDGGRMSLQMIIVPVWGGGGKAAGALGVIEDLTYLEKARADMKAAHDNFTALVESNINGIVIIQDGTCKFVNGLAAGMLKLKQQDLIGRQFTDYVLPEQRDEIVRRCDECLAGHAPEDSIVIKPMMKNETMYVELSCSRVHYGGHPAVLLLLKDVTEWKIMQDKLTEERKMAQKYLDTAEVIMLVLDVNGNVSLINRKGMQVFGYSEQEMKGKNWFDFFLPDRIRERSREHFRQFVSGERPIMDSFSSPALTAANVVKSISWHNALLKDEGGRTIGTIHSGTDVTEQNKLQQELFLRARLLDFAIDSIYMLDEKGNFVYVNENTWKTRGFERQEMLGKNVKQFIADEQKPVADQRIQEIITRGEYNFETAHLRKDGTVFPVEVHASQFISNNKRYLMAIARDITERKMADQVLSRSEERFRTILEEMDNGYFELDLHGQYKFVNDAMCKILGLKRSDIVAQHFTRFVDQTDEKFKDSIKMVIDEVIEKGNAVSGLFGTIIRGDGARRIIGVSISPMKETAGKPTGLRGITRDITDRMKMEQQLLITSKLASIGELAAGVAHEINNPLTAITGFAQLLMAEEDLPEQVRSDLEKIYSQSQRAAKIVKNLLTFSRSYSLEKKVININDLIVKTLDMRSYEHRVNNIDIICDLSPVLPGISADENQIQQVILNILVNAQQSIISSRRNGIIKVTTMSTDHKVKIMIADNGPGIPQGLLQRIFDPFFTTKDVGSGTGLGLSVCHGIITKHGGTLSVESVEGSGATFAIELPAVSEEESTPSMAQPVSRKKLEARSDKRCVLVVDDEVVIRDILHRILSERGYSVDTAESGSEGMEKMEKQEYDAYLLDIKMPGIDGKDLFEAISRNTPHLTRRIIFITGDTITKSTQDFLESTHRPYLSKPFDFSRLISNIEELIRTR